MTAEKEQHIQVFIACHDLGNAESKQLSISSSKSELKSIASSRPDFRSTSNKQDFRSLTSNRPDFRSLASNRPEQKHLTLGLAKSFEVFVVVLSSSGNSGGFHEVMRTETANQGISPAFSTPAVFAYLPSQPAEKTLVFDVYIRKSAISEKLSDQEQIGSVTLPFQEVLHAPHLRLEESVTAASGLKSGTLKLFVEHTDLTFPEGNNIFELDVQALALRKRDWSRSFIAQRFEIWRAHARGHIEEETHWILVYRSERVNRQRETNQHVDFTTASLSYRHLFNGDDERQLRIVVSSHSAKSGKPADDLGFVDFTFAELCWLDPTYEAFSINVPETPPHDGGKVLLVRNEPTEYGGSFAMSVNYRSSDTHAIAEVGTIQKAMSSIVKTPTLLTPRSIRGNKKSPAAKHLVPSDLFGGDYSD